MNNDQYPKPYQPVRGSKSGKPIMAALDLLGRSWALGILWHLGQQSCKFRTLQNLCASISPTTLNKRIKELTQAGLITRSIEGYLLTEQGIALTKLLYPLNDWANDWASESVNNSENQ